MAKLALITSAAPVATDWRNYVADAHGSIQALIAAHKIAHTLPEPAEEIVSILFCARSWDGDLSDADGLLAADYIATFDGCSADECRLPFIDAMRPSALRIMRAALLADATHAAYEAGFLVAAE